MKARRSRRLRWLALVPIALGVGGTAAAAPAGAATIVGPRDSIQAAVEAAAPSETILVFGRHRENVVVTTDALTIRGMGAVLEPPVAPVANACFDPAVPGESVKGICVSGDVDFETGEVSRYVKNVTISGLTVRGFTGFGISTAAAQSTTIEANTVQDNGDAGIAVIASTGTRVQRNRASGNRFGIFMSGTTGGSATGNAVHDNCVGAVVLGEPLIATGARIADNRIAHNTAACPATPDWPALSGVGIALIGAGHSTLTANVITGNVPASETSLSGGLIMIAAPQGTIPSHNRVTDNTIVANKPDVLWDATGAGNVFVRNVCRTSTPTRLCR